MEETTTTTEPTGEPVPNESTEPVISDVNVLNLKEDMLSTLNDFYHSYLVQTVDSSIQVFQSFSYGELVISFLLLCILLVMCFKWFWEVIAL